MTQLISLPAPAQGDSAYFADVLVGRRTVREFSAAALTLDTLSQLLFAGQGQIAERRTTPSAGAFYPLHLWVSARHVSGLDSGVYSYTPAEHGLTFEHGPAVARALDAAALEEQPWVGAAAAVIVVAADMGAIAAKFHEQPPEGKRGARYAHIESGACAQNMYMQCAASGGAGVLVAGFDDSEVKNALGLPENLEPLILFCAGQRKAP
ncbi:MAG: SagB/ThcOx family dehydrogenase [Gammaproteobacteria bacterium]|nr:SagB/ThcOx family dehydrogenase [Gammaproteobacteria bacterium]